MTDFNGKVLADKYLVNSIMREDSLGNLYYGIHQKMEKPVTVKILQPALAVDETIVRRFTDEAKTLSRISHPNILNVTDSGTDKDQTEFIIYESAEGETLSEAIKKEGQFPLERANRIIRQIAAALSVAHTNGVVHQKLTGENILLTNTATESDFVKVLNFGTAANDELSFNEEPAVYGAQYFSPEQCAYSGEVDARSDIYTLGVILYEMLTGEVPFTAEKPSDIMLKHAQEPPLPLSAFRDDLPYEIEAIVLTALSKNPDARYQTVNDLAAALNRVTMLSSESAATATVAYPNLPPQHAAEISENPENNIWKTAFIMLAGIAVLSSFFIYMTQVKQTNPPTQLQTDAEGLPVQPVNPPVGTSEQSLSNMGAYSPDLMTNPGAPTVNGMPQVLPGGDGYDPWARGGIPPQGAPQGGYPTYIPPPTGQYYDGNINPNSPFMSDGNTYILVPKNTNTNVNTQPQKKTPAANVNAQPTPAETEKPAPATTATPTETKPKPTPAPKTTPQPKNDNSQKPAPSGKELDT
jgi:serine/threonine protein kinase